MIFLVTSGRISGHGPFSRVRFRPPQLTLELNGAGSPNAAGEWYSDETVLTSSVAAQAYRLIGWNCLCVCFYGWSKADKFIAAWRAAGFRPSRIPQIARVHHALPAIPARASLPLGEGRTGPSRAPD